MKYVLVGSDGYGKELVELTDAELDALSNKDDYKCIGNNETLDDYLHRKWTVTEEYSLWVEDLDKKVAIARARRQEQEALAAAEEASRLAAIIPPTEAELAAQAAEQFAIVKSAKANDIHSNLKFNLEKGATYNGKTVSTDQYSLILLNGAFALASAGQWPIDGEFKLDGVLTSVTASDILGIFGAVQSHVISCYNRERTLIDSLETVTDIAGLDALDLTW